MGRSTPQIRAKLKREQVKQAKRREKDEKKAARRAAKQADALPQEILAVTSMLLGRRDLAYVLDCLEISPPLREKLRNCTDPTVRLTAEESAQIGDAASRRLEASGLDENYDPYGEARYLENLIGIANPSGTDRS